MIMKTNLFFISIFSLVLVGCSKYLDTSPDQRTELDTPTKIAELLTSANPRANYIPFMETASDNAGDKGERSGVTDPLNRSAWIYEDIISNDEDSPNFYWFAAYKAISAANHALRAIDKLGLTEETKPLRGEALVARAYAHHMLVMLFAQNYEPNGDNESPGIPYVTMPETEIVQKYSRNTVQYVYDQIEKDLVEGIPLIVDNRYKITKYHFTRAAAHAFACRFYLFKGDLDKALEHSNLALGDDLSNFIRHVNDKDFLQREYFLKQQWYTIATNPSNLLLIEAPSLWGRNLATNRYGFTATLLSDLLVKKNVTNGAFAYPIFGGDSFVYHVPKFREMFVKSSINANYGIAINIIPALTSDELLLNRAEIYARKQQFDKCIKDLNTFISKKIYFHADQPEYMPLLHNVNARKINAFYGSENLELNLIKTVLDFKRREFLFEGIRWMDILRMKIPVQHKAYDETVTYILSANSPKRMFQLPQEVIISGLEPNPR